MGTVRAHVHAVVESRILYVIGGLLSAMLLLYAYLVTGIILEVVLRQELEVAIKEKHSSMAALESQYLNKGREITQTFAINLGFVPLQEEEYASRETISRALDNPIR